jgi:hypothetical protein
MSYPHVVQFEELALRARLRGQLGRELAAARYAAEGVQRPASRSSRARFRAMLSRA